MSHFIKEVIPLSDYVKKLSDTELADIVSNYQASHRWELTDAHKTLYNSARKEWVKRHDKKPMPKLMTNFDMILQKTDNFLPTYKL
tara:strand:- start:905 stop:1162 length:258 start_codon:yes stop_codon:yes gene_type:complete